MTGLLRKEGAKERFKLDALIDDALEPLSELLGEKRWFLDEDKRSTLDALALGYLSLAIKPDLPSSWLRDGVKRYPNLFRFAQRGIKEIYGGDVSLQDARISGIEPDTPGLKGENEALRWRTPESVTVSQRFRPLLQNMWASIPLPFWQFDFTAHSSASTPANKNAVSKSSTALAIAAATTSVVTAIAAYAYFGIGLRTRTVQQDRNLSDMGDAGAMLSIFDFGGAQGNDTQPTEKEGKIEVAAVGVASEGG